MAQWLKKTLFGRQLSHGSDKDSPVSFEEAFQTPFNFEQEQQQYNVEDMPTLTPSQLPPGAAGIGPGASPSPGTSEMQAAYNVSPNESFKFILV